MYGCSYLEQGTLAYGIVKIESRFFEIPEKVSGEEAALLLFAGAGVFSAFDSYGAKLTDRVGVIGVGRLGHLAI